MRSLIILLALLLNTPFKGYNGFIQEASSSHQPDKSVRIGFLIPDKNSHSALRGAEQAIKDANGNGGYNGLTFQLVVKTMEGPWGTGSKQAIDLIFKDNVCAIVGSHDGRNAHLVEQAATKARVVFISCLAGDPTLSQAFVPWFFTVVPTDIQQADLITDDIFNKKKFNKIVAFADSTYDSQLALESFEKKIKLISRTNTIKVLPHKNIAEIPSGTEAVLLFGKYASELEFINNLLHSTSHPLIYGSLSFLTGRETNDIRNSNKVNCAYFKEFPSKNYEDFTRRYQKEYGMKPDLAAAFAYDGISTLIRAIRKSGIKNDELRQSIEKTQFEGVTGSIKFDDKGKRTGPLCLRQPETNN